MRGRYVRLVRAETNATVIAKQWKARYFSGGKWLIGQLACCEEIYNLLVELGNSTSASDVAEVIGNNSWSYITCNSCASSVQEAVEVGEHETRLYCRICVAEMTETLSSGLTASAFSAATAYENREFRATLTLMQAKMALLEERLRQSPETA